MSLNLVKYTFLLRNKAVEYEKKDLNGKTSKIYLERHARKIISFVVSVLLIFLLDNGFSDVFISYVSTILSILIGLLITALIFSFDKFYKKEELKNASSQKKLIDVQSFNFSKQFSFITGYNIILSIFTLVLLSLNTLFPDIFSENILEYCFTLDTIKYIEVKNFFFVLIIIVQRFLILYWLISIIYFTIFIISSLVNYMSFKTDLLGK